MQLGASHLAGLAVALATAGIAQSPPPTGPVSTVGTTNQQQSGGPLGTQRIGAFCTPAFFRSAATIGLGGVGLGGSMVWWTEALHPTTTPLTQHAAGSCLVLFALAPFAFGALPFPGAASGFDQVFVAPGSALVLPAPWVQTLTSGGGALVPPGGFNRWLLTVDVPVRPALVGTVWAVQAARLDPSNLRLYFSNEYLVQVWN